MFIFNQSYPIFVIMINNPKKTNAFIAIAIFQYLSTIDDKEIVSNVLLESIMKYVNPNNIPDNLILNSTRIQNNIKWNKSNTYELLR